MKSLRQRSYLCFLSAPVSQNLLFITTNNPSIPLRAKDIFPYKRDTDVTNIHCINSTKNGEIIKSWTEITRRRAIGPACVCCLWAFSSAAVYFLLFILFVCLFVPFTIMRGRAQWAKRTENDLSSETLVCTRRTILRKIMNSLWIDFNKTVRLTFASDLQDYVLCSWQGYKITNSA